MKHISLAVLGILPAILSGTAHAQSFRPQITQTVGSGSNESFLVVDFQDGTVDHNYAFGYLYDGSRTGADLIAAVSSGTGLGVTYLYNGGAVDGFSFNGHSEAGFDNNAYWSYYLGNDGRNWSYSTTGIKGRTLSNGSWDGWSWDVNNADPLPVTPTASAPVPEASTTASLGLLLVLGAGGFLAARRRKPV